MTQVSLTQTRGKTPDPGDLFDDDTKGYDDSAGVHLAPGLDQIERKQASVLWHLFNELWGVAVVKGDPGTGKDLFGNYITYKLKKFFPWKRVWRDEKPRRLYGEYAGLFNESVLRSELATMRDVAKGVRATEIDSLLEKAADDWVRGAGEMLLKNSVLYLTEYWRYCYNREPHNPMNKTMGAVQKVKRHLDTLVIGTTQLIEELDKKTSLPWIDWRVTCTRSVANPTGFTYFVERVKYDRRLNILLALPGRPFPISFDAGKPRSDMGDGRIVLKRPGYRPETEEERIVLDVLREGVDNYEQLVGVLETQGDMPEWETLNTLKEMGLKLPGRRPKFVVWYPCYFWLYNSKSVPQIKTTLRVSE